MGGAPAIRSDERRTRQLSGAPAIRSEERRTRQLAVTKRRATALLCGATVVFIAVTLFGGHATWAGYVQATAEASMVGGLADWFAVTALFRRPLGLPIPHTAIVAERKEQFGTTLGEFVQESLLTPEAIAERVQAADVVGRLADWLAAPGNGERVAGQAADGAVAAVDLLRDEEIRDTIEELLRARVDAVAVAPLAGRMLRYLTDDGRYEPVVDASLRSLDRYLEAHRDELRTRLSERSPWWLPGAVEDRIFERLLEGARAVVREMVGQPEHHLRQDLQARLVKFISDLETSPDLRDRGEELKRELLAQPQLRDWAGTLWAQMKAELREQASDPESLLRERLSAAITGGGERLRSDAELRSRVEQAVESAVCYVADRFNPEIAALISATIARWDSEETSRRLELLLGPDLQYIRINGTIVGGLAGLALYALSRAL